MSGGGWGVLTGQQCPRTPGSAKGVITTCDGAGRLARAGRDFRPYEAVAGGMQREYRLRGDRGSWTGPSARGDPAPGGQAERPGSGGADRRPRDLIRAMPANGDRPAGHDTNPLSVSVHGSRGLPPQPVGRAMAARKGFRLDISCAFPTALGSPDRVALAEELGYVRAWLYDTPQQSPDVWMMLALAAERTSRIGLGPGVLVPALRHPMVNAAGTAALAALAPGRVAVAFGTGFSGRRAMGYRAIPWSYMDAYIRAYRGLLRGETIEWEGARMRMLHPAGHALGRPVDVPVLIAALGPKGHAVARELGDGSSRRARSPRMPRNSPGSGICSGGRSSTRTRTRARSVCALPQGLGWPLPSMRFTR